MVGTTSTVASCSHHDHAPSTTLTFFRIGNPLSPVTCDVHASDPLSISPKVLRVGRTGPQRWRLSALFFCHHRLAIDRDPGRDLWPRKWPCLQPYHPLFRPVVYSPQRARIWNHVGCQKHLRRRSALCGECLSRPVWSEDDFEGMDGSHGQFSVAHGSYSV